MTSVVLAVGADELSSLRTVELLIVLVDGVVEVLRLIYFLKNYASYSTETSYFNCFLWTGGGIAYEYELVTSNFKIESLIFK